MRLVRHLHAKARALQKARVLSLEMETASLYTLASLYGFPAGAVLAVFKVSLLASSSQVLVKKQQSKSLRKP
jgi:uridine phosphorylase